VAEPNAGREGGRRWWPLAAGIVLGVVAGLLVSLLQSGIRRAEASVLISSPAGPPAVKPLLPNLRELATSGVVAGNVRSTLRLDESTEALRRHLHATVRPRSEVIAISASDEVADHARQVTQEAAVVFSQLVESRFGTGKPELHAAVLDSAHVLAGPDRHVARNLLIGGLVGLLLGSATLFVLAARRPPVVVEVPADDSDLKRREQLLAQRVSGVSAREQALASRAGKLTAREQELEVRSRKLTTREQELEARAAKLEERAGELEATEHEFAARTEESLPPPPLAVPEPIPDSASEPAESSRQGAWNLDELERMVEAVASAPPEQLQEWRTYLFYLREHARHDGALPRSLDPLISYIFAEVVDRGTPR
jgi:hypothetical protein